MLLQQLSALLLQQLPCTAHTQALTQRAIQTPARPQSDALKEQEDAQGFTPLATAAETGNEEIASLLLDRGVDVNQRGSPQKRAITALMVAAAHKQVRRVACGGHLVAAVHSPPPPRVKPQYLCLRTRPAPASKKPRPWPPAQEPMIKLLLDNGADVNLQDANGHTPL